MVVLLFGYHTSTSGAADDERHGVVPAAPRAAPPRPARPGTGGAGTGDGIAGSPAPRSTVTGSVAQTRWGPVQVRAHRRAAGRSPRSTSLQYPNGNAQGPARSTPTRCRSWSQETLDAQSADIDMVSGATVTSDGYLQSLQSALDQAGL